MNQHRADNYTKKQSKNQHCERINILYKVTNYFVLHYSQINPTYWQSYRFMLDRKIKVGDLTLKAHKQMFVISNTKLS